MLLGPPPPRADSRCLWWDEPRRVVLQRSPALQALLVAVFLFYCIAPPLTGSPLVASVITSPVLVAIVVTACFYRRRVAIDAPGIWLMPVTPFSLLNPFLSFFTVAGMRQSSRSEIACIRIVDAIGARPAEMIVSRKYAKPYTIVVAPSISLSALVDALHEFGIATEREVA